MAKNEKQVPATVDADDLANTLFDELGDTINLDTIEKRTDEILEALDASHGTRFVQGARNLYFDADLEGRAFVIVSDPHFTWVEDNFSKNGGRKQVARCLVRLVEYDDETGERILHVAKEARIQGAYALNQIRSMTRNELVGSVIWTLARNYDGDAYTTGGGNVEYPRMLAPFKRGEDTPVRDNVGDMDFISRAKLMAERTKALKGGK